MPSWLQINISGPSAQLEAVADYIVGLTGRGVEIIEQNNGHCQVKAYLENDQQGQADKQQLQEYLAQLGQQVQFEFMAMDDQDWHETWRENFAPFHLTSQIWIAPPWQVPPVEHDQTVIVIDPGQAFGTGQHQSTHLCVFYLEQLAQKRLLPSSMLDVGCGTGILALAFLKLGGKYALGVDIDPLALEASEHNARLNEIEGLRVATTPLQELAETFPLIAANLTAQDLIDLAQPISARLQPMGLLLCSGLLTGQINAVCSAYAPYGLNLEEQSSLSGWSALLLRKNEG